MDEMTGVIRWRFSAGTAVNEQPVAIDDLVFVIPELGGMTCLEAGDGATRWFVPNIRQFLAASPTRVYAADEFGQTLVLDVKTGGRVDTLPTMFLPLKFANLHNDRLFLGTRTGMLMCLHEESLAEPAVHRLPGSQQPDAAAMPEAAPAKEPDAQAPQNGGANPF
jgi:hypothetical protein